MSPDDISSKSTKKYIREQAEKTFKNTASELLDVTNTVLPQEVQELIHELQVHQIELEMQNDELLLTQGKLKESNERYYDLYNKAPVGYCTLNEDGLIMDSNKTVSEMFGVSQEVLQKKRITDLISKEDQDIYYFCCTKFLEKNKETSCELRMKNYKGFKFWVQICATMEKGLHGSAYIRIVIMDITQNKNAQEEIQKLNESLKDEVASQLEELREKDSLLMEQATLAQLGEMVNMIAHQWRQPLNAISGAAVELSLLNMMGDVPKEKISQNAKFTQEVTKKISDTIDEFMDFNKSVDTAIFSLLRIVEKTVDITLPQFKTKSISLEINIDKELRVFHNQTAIKHALLNVFINSRDAFAENKRLKKCKINIYTKAEKNATVLCIEDNAGGIAKNVLCKVFNPYFTTKEQGKGTGLGLYMTKKMIEKVKGSTISLHSVKDTTIVKIKFPISS